MPQTLPQPAADYIAACNAHDPQAVAACFTEDAVVEDENKTHVGRPAIQAWIAEADRLYAPIIAVEGFTADGPTVTLSGKVSGTFPGSPVVLRFFFTLAGEKIGKLTIVV